MKNLIKHYWLVLLIIVTIPIVINFILIIPAPVPNKLVVGTMSDWLGFWAVYLGASATFAMVFVTYKTIKQNDKLIAQNNEQLDEIKRQWKEQNRPRLSSSLSIGREFVMVDIRNTSTTPAHNVKISLVNNTNKDILHFNELKGTLENMSFEIPPNGLKQIPIYGINAYRDGKYEGYITVDLLYDEAKESYDLYLKEINAIVWQYGAEDIYKILNDINSSIQHFKIQ